MKRLLLISLAILMMSGFALAEDEKPERRTLVVTGTAEVSVAPDICYMSFAVETYNNKAAEAYRENVETMNRINSAIKSHGIEPKDMKTQYFSFTPQYRYTDRGKRIFEGYQVYNTLMVSVRDLSKVSAVLDAAVEAGAYDVQSINFTIENPKEYTEEARREALKVAKKKAQESAEILGFRLGTPISVSESEPGYYQPYSQANVALERSTMYMDGGAGGIALEAGEQKLSRTVYVTWEILPK
ncbi:SIMPL domain-containing protein [candidate division WOR-3 bacterium]|nr:SIMPL domain-containing protein [candidate division WOR-3 bacterium]